MRIVSLVPSLTKTICDLGLKDSIVGITNFCVDPPDLHRKARRVGGTKDPDLNIIKELAPSHVVVNSEENRQSDIDFIKGEFPTLVTFPKSPNDVPDLLSSLGEFLGVTNEADSLAAKISEELTKTQTQANPGRDLKTRFLYLIWRDPWMAVGRDTYISKFLELLGFVNVIDLNERYPIVDLESFINLDAEVIFLSSEPWPFRRRDADYLRKQLGQGCPKLSWIDGKAFSWYGTTTLDALLEAQKPSRECRLIRDL